MTISTSTYLNSIVTRLIYKSVLVIAMSLSSGFAFGQFTNVQVYPGKDTAICKNSTLDLRSLRAYITGEVTDGTWFTTGDGRFLPSNTASGKFSITDRYRPGATDINKGYVDLFLTSFDPDGIGPKIQITERLRLTLLNDPPMVCNTNLNVSLAAQCRQEILASMVLSNFQGNNNDYTVKLLFNGIELPSNVITREYLNKTLEFKVQHNCGESNCWGYITAQDKEAPRLQCRDTTIDCTSSILPDSIGFPLPFANITLIGNNRYRLSNADNCGDAILVYTDEIVKLSCASTGFNERINRRWEAVDDLGNKRTCTQIIHIIARPISTIALPPHYDDIDKSSFLCGGNFAKLPSGHPSPEASGRPFAMGCSNLEFTFTDTKLAVCGESFKIIRKWLMIDWCQSQTREHNQIIKVLDKTPPTIECPSNLTMSTTAYDCHTGMKELPIPKITDNCGSFTHQINIIDSLNRNQNIFLTQINNKYFTNNLPFGKYKLQYIAIDDCGNKDTCYTHLTVIDNQPPFVFCTDKLVVNLNESSYLRLFPESVNLGSTDNCGIAKYEVAKMTDQCKNNANVFGPFAEFCCSDLGKTVMVLLKVTDRSGNMNTCMIEVTVRDKIPPVITCPPSITINCDHAIDLKNLHEFGRVVDHVSKVKDIRINGVVVGQDGTAIDTCGVTISEKVTDLRKCHQGQIIRTFYATDASGNVDSCIQTINIINNKPFSFENIQWPRDTTIEKCNPDSISIHMTGIPKYDNEKCAVIIADYEDQVFKTSETGNCFKIIRRWKVLDWCRFENGDKNAVGYKDQIIKLTNKVAPILVTTCQDTSICNHSDTCGSTAYSKTFFGSDDCTSNVQLRWSWTIDLYNNGSADINGLTSTVSTQLPNGKHKVNIELKDACGNFTNCVYFITVKDCKAPTPYCILSLSTAIMETGMIAVWAKDFDRGSFDNCTAQSKLKYSFSKNILDTARIFTCDSLLNVKSKAFKLEMWVTDEDGNQDHCTTLLTVQDNGNICKSGNSITSLTGNIKDIHGFGLSAYSIIVKDMEFNEITRKKFTTPTYKIDSLYSNNQYMLFVEKENKLGDEINVFDLIKIQKHILGIKKFASPHEFLAADVDDNGRINVSDIVEIRRYILGITEMYETPINVWQFVKANHVFNSMSRPDRNEQYIVTDTLKVENNRLDIDAYQLGNVESFGQILSTRTALDIPINVVQINDISELRMAKSMTFEALQFDLELSVSDNKLEINPKLANHFYANTLKNGKKRILIFGAEGIELGLHDWILKTYNNLIEIENKVGVIDGIKANILLSKTKEKLPISIFQKGNYINLETKNVFSSTAKLELYNSNGQMVMNTPMNESTDFDISHLKSGIYFYNISDNRDIYKGKLFIKLE